MDAGQKVLNQIKLVPQQSTDKICDLCIDNHGFCLQVCTKPYMFLSWSESFGTQYFEAKTIV